jgi:hypothetical protein
MNPTTTTTADHNYYGLLSINDEEYIADDATVITSNKSTANPIYEANILTTICNANDIMQHSILKSA